MFKKWVGKNVDLELLARRIADFFRDRDFEVKFQEITSGYMLIAIPPQSSDITEKVSVKILGDPNDFVLEFLCGEKARFSIWSSFVATVLGGGGFLLRGLRSKEAIEDIEGEFWVSVEKIVEDVVYKAQKS